MLVKCEQPMNTEPQKNSDFKIITNKENENTLTKIQTSNEK